jgi:hypothetical protein
MKYVLLTLVPFIFSGAVEAFKKVNRKKKGMN